jgi:nicotinamide riboside kinase
MKNNKFLCAVIGSQNTGKSTFIKDIISKYNNNEIYESFVTDECDYRKVIEEKHLSINREGNLESQRVIFDCLSQQVIDAIRNPDYKNVIFDRSPIDAYVYTKYLNDKGKVDDRSIEIMTYEMIKFSSMYDTIIYIPLDKCEDVKVVDDKFRDTDLEYRSYVDKLFNNAISLLDDSTMDNVIEIYGTREERLRMFYEHCNQRFIIKDKWLNNI